MYFLLFDEVQLLGNFEAVLNGYMRKDNLDIYITRSDSQFLSSDILADLWAEVMKFIFYHYQSFILRMTE